MIVKIKKTGLKLVTGVATFLDTINSWVLQHLPQLSGKPYTEFKDKEGDVTRLFYERVNPQKLKWHMDDEDRIIQALHKNNWQFQLEDQLPVPLNKPIFIERHQWHRLIKGDGSLMIKVTKICKQSVN
jgi:hypothetical protein